MRTLVFILSVILLQGCVGVEHLDDPIVGESIKIAPDPLMVLKGQATMATAVFKDQYGIEKSATPVWSTADPLIATVDGSGLVSGKNSGQTFLNAIYGTVSTKVLVTVVVDANAVAQVDVTTTPGVLGLGQNVTMTASVKNINGQTISGKTIIWQSNNDQVLSVNANGIALAKANGTAAITATVEGVTSNPVLFTVGAPMKMGVFVKSGGYDASGTATLNVVNNRLILKFESDFKTSFALGTFIYLANNSTVATTVKSAGLEISQITQNGPHSFDITAINPIVKIDDYKYVIILCKPATVIFGYAELK